MNSFSVFVPDDGNVLCILYLGRDVTVIADLANKRYGDEVRGSIPTMAPCHGSPVD